MRDHTYHLIHRFVATNGETIEVHYTPATRRTVAVRTFPGDTTCAWSNWVTSLVDAQQNCIQSIAVWSDLVTIVGTMALRNNGFASVSGAANGCPA
jgi:hypothetical protein